MDIDRYYVLDCVIAPESNAISRGDKHIHLEPKVMDCLVFFIKHSNEILTRDELIHSVWHDRVVNEEAVNRIIYLIRNAFHELGIEQELLVTHRKRGYQWTLHAEHSHQAAPTDIAEANKTANNFRWLATISLGICFSLLLAVALMWPTSNALDTQAVGKPLVVISVDPELITPLDDLINRLVESINEQGSLSATRTFNNNQRPALTLTFKKTYNTLLESYDYVVTLSDQGVLQWQYQFPLNQDPLSLSTQYQHILKHFSQQVSTSTHHDPCQWPANMASVEHYFAAKSLISRRGENELSQAIEHLNIALKLSPNFAKAWSTLAFAHDLLPSYSRQGKFHPSSLNHQERATRAAKQALSLCATSAEAILLASEVPQDWQINALTHYYYRLQQALNVAPDNSEIMRAASEFYWRMGYVKASIEWLERAAKLDPWNGQILSDMADSLLQQGLVIDAEATLLNAQEFGIDSHKGNRLSWFRLYIAQNNYMAAQALLNHHAGPQKSLLDALLRWYQQPSADHYDALISLLTFTLHAVPQQADLIHKIALLANHTDLAVEAWLISDHSLTNGVTLWWHGAGKLFSHVAFQRWLVENGYIDFWRHTGAPDTCQLQGNNVSCEH
ncbi:MAG TPA: winged helix-turn-helix domain-containing protein [Pseudomonadales bacterium]|nr:winged helix-turn-helix domain-containing protein [Pseudomonadales bacterium]